jgi:hypothetical protein
MEIPLHRVATVVIFFFSAEEISCSQTLAGAVFNAFTVTQNTIQNHFQPLVPTSNK